MPVCGVEAYNKRSFWVKYCSQGVQTSFYETTASASDSLGNTISQRVTEDSRNARVLFEVRKASGGWQPVIDLKQLNHHIDAPHFRMHTVRLVLSTVEREDYAICRMRTFMY